MTTDVAIPYAGVCVGCGYDLRGLAAEGACPECGMMIAHSMAARGFRYANHRWLGKIRIGAWLFLGASLLILLASVPLFVLPDTWIAYSLRSYLYWAGSGPFMGYLELLRIAAIWLLTSPEPGPPRADSPAMSRLWARWLGMFGYCAELALVCLPALLPYGQTSNSPRYWFDFISYMAGYAGTICLLIMMRRYAMRDAAIKAAGSLKWAAILGGVAVIVLIAGRVMYGIVPPSTYMSLLVPMVAASSICWCAAIWGVDRFAVGLGRAVHSWRPALQLSKTRMYPIAALVVGGIAGQLAGEVLYIQAQRIPGSELGAVLTRTGGELWRVGVIVGVAALPNRIAMLQRRLTRWQRREGTARV